MELIQTCPMTMAETLSWDTGLRGRKTVLRKREFRKLQRGKFDAISPTAASRVIRKGQLFLRQYVCGYNAATAVVRRVFEYGIGW